MPFLIRQFFAVLRGTRLDLAADGPVPPSGGQETIMIPRSWLVVGATTGARRLSDKSVVRIREAAGCTYREGKGTRVPRQVRRSESQEASQETIVRRVQR